MSQSCKCPICRNPARSPESIERYHSAILAGNMALADSILNSPKAKFSPEEIETHLFSDFSKERRGVVEVSRSDDTAAR